jgi:ubiquinone/menaquinone biosynthesis C-methylase UbiE
MGTESVRNQRREALAPARGEVLEIGFGTGRNLPHYPQAVTSLTALDPADLLRRKRRRRIAEARMPVELVGLSAETLPFEGGRFDCVVSTWTLCTIPDAAAAVREIARVLKAGGEFIFLEHGRSDDAKLARRQDRFNPIQRKIACGCNMNRRIDTLIRQGGMDVKSLERYVMDGVPRVLGEMYRGIAAPAETPVRPEAQ